MTEDTTGVPHEPGAHSGTPREPGPRSGALRDQGPRSGALPEPGSWMGIVREPGSHTGAPRDRGWPGTPRGQGGHAEVPREPGSRTGTAWEPGGEAGAHEPGWAGTPREPGSHADAPRGPGSQWYDHEAGPLVRPYAMTGGRTEPGPSGVRFDLIALVTLDPAAPAAGDPALGPEHRALMDLCRPETQSVAELAAGADLPVGVVRVLLGDLLERGRVTVSRPVPPAHLPDERVLREVIAGLRAL